MERAVMGATDYPEMRNEVIDALRSLSDPVHQRTRWGKVEEGIEYYDDLTLNVHVLYDDIGVLPSPGKAVPGVLYPAETPHLRAVGEALGPLIRELGDSPDDMYLDDPRWASVIHAARTALEIMRACDSGSTQ